MTVIKTRTVIVLTLGTALGLGATAAMAHGDKDGRGPQGRAGGLMGGVMLMEFTDLDMDGNGQITAEDLQAHTAARFAAIDANGDGELSKDELITHRADMKAKRQAQSGQSQMGKGPMAEKRMGWMIEEMIERRDANGNGALSLDEMRPDAARFGRMIDRFDTDDDNAISQAEFEAAQKEVFMEGRGKHGHGKHGHGKRHGG